MFVALRLRALLPTVRTFTSTARYNIRDGPGQLPMPDEAHLIVSVINDSGATDGEAIGIKLYHKPSGITVESLSGATRAENRHRARHYLSQQLYQKESSDFPQDRRKMMRRYRKNDELYMERKRAMAVEWNRWVKAKEEEIAANGGVDKSGFMERIRSGEITPWTAPPRHSAKFKRGVKEKLEWPKDKPLRKKQAIWDSNGVKVDFIVDGPIKGEIILPKRPRLKIVSAKPSASQDWMWEMPGIVEIQTDGDYPANCVTGGDGDDSVVVMYRGLSGSDWMSGDDAAASVVSGKEEPKKGGRVR